MHSFVMHHLYRTHAWQKLQSVLLITALILSSILPLLSFPQKASAAVGDYTGTHFDTAASGNASPVGITWDGTYFWITDSTDAEVYRYNSDGSYSSFSFDTAATGNTALTGITWDGTYFWITDSADAEVYRYNANGTYSSFSFDTNGSGNGNALGITWDGTYFWVTDNTDDEVYRYNANGTYSSFSFDTAGSGNTVPVGISWDGTYLWVTGNGAAEIYRHNSNGTYSSLSFDTAGSGNGSPWGLVRVGTDFWTVDITDAEAYKYEGPVYTTAPTVTTGSASSITASTATIAGNITNNGGADATQRGFAYGTASNLATVIATTTDGSFTGTGAISTSTTGLSPNTTYYFRAYATNSAGTGYGSIQNFKTATTTPTVTTGSASSITASTATIAGAITATGGENATQHGIAYGTSANLSTVIATSTKGAFSGTGSFSDDITSLSPGTTYYVRAYAANSEGTSYGSIQSFTSSTTVPTLSTNAATNVATSSATLNGNITNTGGETGAGTSHGFAYGTSTTLTGANVSTTTLGTYSASGAFSGAISGLTASTTYYFRPYAVNSAGTSTGAIMSFTTATTPSVTTSAASGVTQTAATLNGEITALGGENAIRRGFAWGTNSALNGGDTATTTSNGSFSTGTFTHDLSSLTPNATYYARAYAVNSYGTSTGSIVSFTMLDNTPAVTSDAASSVTRNAAQLNGTITSTGGESGGTQHGFAWGTNASLSGGNTATTTLGSISAGAFNQTLSSLNRVTTYYARAYVTNSVGTRYGSVVSFTTLDYSGSGDSLNAAAAGAGIVSGGNDGGGGESIGSEIDFVAPSGSAAVSAGGLTSGANAYASDGSYTTAGASAASDFQTFNFNIPATDSITGISVKLEASASSAAGNFSVELSWNGGSSMTSSSKTTSTLTTSDVVYTLGGSSDTWGRSWTPSELSNANFKVRITGNPSSNTVRLDAIQVRVYHQATGGGGGGGGEI